MTGARNWQSFVDEKTNEDLQHSFTDNSSRLVQTFDNRTQSLYLSNHVKVDTSNQLDTDEDRKQSCDTEVGLHVGSGLSVRFAIRSLNTPVR